MDGWIHKLLMAPPAMKTGGNMDEGGVEKEHQLIIPQ
jgi:hypothetical protein